MEPKADIRVQKTRRRISKNVGAAAILASMCFAPSVYQNIAHAASYRQMVTTHTTNGQNAVKYHEVAGDAAPYAALGAAYSLRSTTATKTAGFGGIYINMFSSTLGTGTAVEHRWKITVTPPSGSFTTTDKRPGAQNGDTINGWEEWFAPAGVFPIETAGVYGISCTITDSAGNTDTLTDINGLTVAAQSSPTTIYVNGNATGANDGSSAADAYTSIQSGLNDLATAAGNAILYIEGGQTYVPTSRVDLRGDANIRIEATGGSNAIIDMQNCAASWAIFGGENQTVIGITGIDTVDATSSKIVIYGVTTNAEDMVIKECAIGSTGNTLQDLVNVELSAGATLLMWDCDGSEGCARYSGCSINSADNMSVFGGTFGIAVVERPFRKSGGSSTFIGVDIFTGHKDCVRLQDGKWHTFYRSKLRLINNGQDPTTCIMLGENSGTPENIIIERCYLSVDSDQADASQCIGDAAGTPVGDEHIMVRGSYLQQVSSNNTTSPIGLSSLVVRQYLAGCTVVGNSPTANANILSMNGATEVRVEGNILQYAGPTTGSAFNDQCTDIPVTVGSMNNNVLDPGNTQDTSPYEVGTTSYNLANLNAQPEASGNVEQSPTYDANYLPSVTTTVDVPAGLFVDYYGNALTQGGTMIAGAVQSVPVAPTLIAVSSPANQFRSRIRAR